MKIFKSVVCLFLGHKKAIPMLFEDDFNIAIKLFLEENTQNDALSLLISSGLLNNDFSPLIKFWYQKNKTLDEAYREAGKNSEGFIHKYLKTQ